MKTEELVSALQGMGHDRREIQDALGLSATHVRRFYKTSKPKPVVCGPFITRQQARQQGLEHYFTGVPCSHGHVSVRRVFNGGCVECKKEHYQNTKAKLQAWKAQNPKKVKAKTVRTLVKRRKQDPCYRLRVQLSIRVANALSGHAPKAASTAELTGLNGVELMNYLEALFAPGMTRKNYGEWQVDHIRPCASFDLTDPEQQRECFHYTNLQPLWAADNIAKSDTWEPNEATA